MAVADLLVTLVIVIVVAVQLVPLKTRQQKHVGVWGVHDTRLPTRRAFSTSGCSASPGQGL
jgi:hypothetical protein